MQKSEFNFGRAMINIVILLAVLFYCCSGRNSGKSEISEVPREKATTKEDVQPQIEDISDNPGFFTASVIEPSGDEANAMLKLLVPLFERQLKQVKLVEEHGEYTDGSWPDVKYSLTFISRKLFDMKDGDDLHALFLENGFNPSPRLGKKPQHGRNSLAMSLFKTSGSTVHSMTIRMYMLDSKIIVYVHKPDSPLDRM